MRYFRRLLLLLLIIITTQSYSQRLTVGFLSGVNLSDIHGNQYYGKWSFKDGPINGLFVNYLITKSLSIQTEIARTSTYYVYKNYDNLPIYRNIEPYNQFYSYYPNNAWNFSFYRVPVQLRLTIPGRIKFNLSAGAYLSYCYDFETIKEDSHYSPPKYDHGFIYSAGFAYPISSNLKIFVDYRYTTGRKIYIDQNNGKNGSSELVFGIGYSGFKSKNRKFVEYNLDSTREKKIYITYKAGYILSDINVNQNRNIFKSKSGYSAGISMDFYPDEKSNPNMAFCTGLFFEQKGYQFKDTSAYLYIYSPVNNSGYTISNKSTTSLSYLIIPINLKLRLGNRIRYYIKGGVFGGFRLNAIVNGTTIIESRSSTSYYRDKYTICDDIEGRTKNFDWGWNVGSGVVFPILEKYNFEIGIDYYSGCTNILDIPKSQLPIGADKSLKNRSMNISLGFQIPIN